MKCNKRKKITQAKYKSTQAQVTQLSTPCVRKRNDRIDSIFHATHATQALAFEWKPDLSLHLYRVLCPLSSEAVITSTTGFSCHYRTARIYCIVVIL